MNSNENKDNPSDKDGVKPMPSKNSFFTTLVVDAKNNFAGDLEEFLKVENYAIERAVSATQALALTRQFQPDLILLDNELEGVSGLALLGELLIEQPSAVIIMLATNPSVDESVEAIKRGAFDYLYRPLDFTKLKAAIEIQKALFKI